MSLPSARQDVLSDPASVLEESPSGLSPHDIAEYVQEISSELEKLCTGAGLQSVAACLALATSEAERLRVHL
ncbi:hypothetical protein [Parvularcula sp. IMCC14364]|uniref:hypothetical protein n=1 Tax=Parvularcula sp. IMCC14364 TaxID=3067902 RepID=UPI0027419C01|nr:hypothetical protein [Parvularcula sp. IMCC14364]